MNRKQLLKLYKDNGGKTKSSRMASARTGWICLSNKGEGFRRSGCVMGRCGIGTPQRRQAMSVDPASFVCGLSLGIVTSRCLFLIWKEREEKSTKVAGDGE